MQSASPLSDVPFSAVAASWTEPVVCFQVRDITVLTDTLFFLCSYTTHVTSHSEKPNINKKHPGTTKTFSPFFICEIRKGHFCHLKAKPVSFVCHRTHRLLSRRNTVHSLGMIFPLRFVCYLLIHMSCSSKTDFVSWHPKLLSYWCCTDCVKESTSHRSASAARYELRSPQRAI